MSEIHRKPSTISTSATDRAIGRLAGGQHGQVGRWQLRQLGVSYSGIARRVARGLLIPNFPGVYSVGHPPTSVLAWAYAAVLACGPDSALSHESAAKLWKMVPRWTRPFHVTSPHRRRPEGVTVHRGKLRSSDVTVQEGIPVTSPARTALDLASGKGPEQLATAVNEGRIHNYLHESDLSEIVATSPGHRGIRALRPLATDAQTQEPTRSKLERDFIRFTHHYGLPKPKTNVKVAGHLVDAYFPDHKLVVELDGWEFHRDRRSFESNRERDADLLAIGHACIRITEPRMTNAADREAARLAKILRDRAPSEWPT